MTFLTRSAATLAAMLTTTALCADPITGMQLLNIADETRPLMGAVWYPTDEDADTVGAHGNAVWQPIQVAPDAAPQDGAHPLVVLSHGMFGNHRNQAWLAQGLVAQGYIVVAIDHPGTSTFLRDDDDKRMLWERPRDISRVIDHLTADPQFADLVDADHIFMAGHSLGGFTALELAGARFDAAKWDAFCDATPDELVCGIFDQWSVAKTPEDRFAMAQDLSDPRIKAFAVFDLGGTQTFNIDSLGAVDTPMIVYGAPDAIHDISLDTESRALIAALPSDTVTYFEPAGLAHMDFLGLCTDQGHTYLLEEEPEDAFVCENGTSERKAEHDLIIQQVSAFFSDQ